MKQSIQIGQTVIPRIGLGTSGFGGYFSSDSSTLDYKNKFISFFHEAFDSGIRFIDTAENYASGYTETLIGLLPKHLKDEFFISTKFNFLNTKQKLIEESLDKSLKRLDRDYVDLYMPHWPYNGMNSDDLINIMINLRDKGKIKFLGLSNFENQLKKMNNVYEINFFESELNPYHVDAFNIFSELDNDEKLNKSSVFVGYAPFKKGLVFNENSKIYNYFHSKKKYTNLNLSQFILLWILSLSDKILVIPKTQSVSRLKEYLKIYKFSNDLLKEFRELSDGISFYQTELIDVNKIIMKSDDDRPIYYNLKDAIENKYGLYPDIIEIASEIKNNDGNLSKPIKLIKDGKSDSFICIDGRLKYWAWVYLHGFKSKIPSVIF